MKSLSIEQLAEKLGGKLWNKEDKKRIYLDRGYNTKKMSTKTYVYQREDGSFGVSCYIDCPSQPYQWIKSQQEEVIKGVEESIEDAMATEIFLIVNEKGNVINENGQEKALNDLYSSDYFINEHNAKKALEDFPAGHSFKVMNRDEFNDEVERLEEIERSMSMVDKLKRGDDILIHSREDLATKTEEIKSSDLPIEEITGHFSIETIGGLTGTIKMKKDSNDLSLALAIEKAESAEREIIEMEKKIREEREQQSARDKEKEENRIAELKAKAHGAGNVIHPKFGTGIILSDDGKIIEIDFHENGIKKLLKKYAPLTKVESND